MTDDVEVVPLRIEFSLNRSIREEHQKVIYCVCCVEDLLASVGGNTASVYRSSEDASIDFLQSYIDVDKDEAFYACAWSFIEDPLLLVGGSNGCVKAINVTHNEIHGCFIGHGNAVNDIKVHPVDQNLVLSASKDESIRMWNLKTNVCIAIFCGQSGHRDEVLRVAIHPLGNCFASGGMDSTIKIWNLEHSSIRFLIKKSYQNAVKSESEPAEFIQFPEFSTNLVHNNYIDSVNWYGNFILSNAVSDKICLWAPNPSQCSGDIMPIENFIVPHVKSWFIHIAVSIELDIFAVGNSHGKIYVYRLAECLPGTKCGGGKNDAKRKDGADASASDGNSNALVILQHPKCNRLVRSITFNEDNTLLIASCDDGTLWVWDIRTTIMDASRKISK